MHNEKCYYTIRMSTISYWPNCFDLSFKSMFLIFQAIPIKNWLCSCFAYCISVSKLKMYRENLAFFFLIFEFHLFKETLCFITDIYFFLF